MSSTTISSRPRATGKRRTVGSPGALLGPGENRTEEQEANETLNEETAAVLQRVLDGTEPTYGPFASVKEMFAFIDSMPD